MDGKRYRRNDDYRPSTMVVNTMLVLLSLLFLYAAALVPRTHLSGPVAAQIPARTCCLVKSCCFWNLDSQSKFSSQQAREVREGFFPFSSCFVRPRKISMGEERGWTLMMMKRVPQKFSDCWWLCLINRCQVGADRVAGFPFNLQIKATRAF